MDIERTLEDDATALLEAALIRKLNCVEISVTQH